MSKIAYYLAHPILDRQWVREKELEMEKDLDISLENPFYDSGGVERGDIKSIDSGKLGIFDRKLIPSEIVEGDLKMIDRAYGLVGIITGKLTVGTTMEIFYNSYVLKRPTYLVITDEKLFFHPWLTYFATQKFHTLDEFGVWFKGNEVAILMYKKVEDAPLMEPQTSVEEKREWCQKHKLMETLQECQKKIGSAPYEPARRYHDKPMESGYPYGA